MTHTPPQASNSFRDMVIAAEQDDRELVSLERKGGYAVVRMSEPEALNRLTGALTIQLLEHFDGSPRRSGRARCDPHRRGPGVLGRR